MTILRPLLPVLLLVAQASGQEQQAPATIPVDANGKPNVDLYTYIGQTGTVLRTAGDELHFSQRMLWQMGVSIGQAKDGRRPMQITIFSIAAEQRMGKDTGQAPQHRFRSSSDDPVLQDDPMLGHLQALVDVPLLLLLDEATWKVLAVSGEEGFVKRVAAKENKRPGIDSPLVKRARELYTAERLAQFWTEILRKPGTGTEQVSLPSPLRGEAERSWQGKHFSLELPAAAKGQTVELYANPTPVSLTLEDLNGTGHVQLDKFGLRHARGSTTAKLKGRHQTQPAELDLTIDWTFGRVELVKPDQQGPSEADETEARDEETDTEPAP